MKRSPSTAKQELFDENLNFKQHIENTSLLFNILDIFAVFASIIISLSIATIIVTALVSSILDYCNSLLYNIANKDIAKIPKSFSKGSLLFSRSLPL